MTPEPVPREELGKPARILVTGIGGFVGRNVAAELRRAGVEVHGTLHPGENPVEGVEHLYEADLLDPKALGHAFAAAKPEVVLHLAGLSHVGRSWADQGAYFRVNLLGTEAVLAAAGEAPVVLASSSEVYGAVPEAEQPILEDRSLDPRNPYALTKAAAERWVLAAGGLVVRAFNLVGPGQAGHFALPSFAQQLAETAAGRREAVLDVGNLSARRDFLHVEDGARGFIAVVEAARRGVRSQVFNLASGSAYSIAEALDMLVQISGQEVQIRRDPERERPVDVPLLRGDASALRGLGWSPRKSLKEAVADLWHLSVEAAAGGSGAGGGAKS